MEEDEDIIEDEELPDEQQTLRERRIAQIKPYQFKKGQSGNALGRYLGGKSGKERARAMIASMTDDEFEEFMEGMNKKDVWEMAEGRPDTKGELDLKGAIIQVSDIYSQKLNAKPSSTTAEDSSLPSQI